MLRTKTQMLRRISILCVVTTLLVLSLLLAACGSSAGSTSTSSSNISTNGTTQQTTITTTTPGGSGISIQSANQQVQTAVSSVDGAQNDVNNADASSTNDNGQQP